MFRNQFSVVKIGVFGSYARDEQTENSDIDIIIDMPPGTKNIFDKRVKLQETISNHFSTPVDVCHERSIRPVFRDLVYKDVIYV
ncbi:MAG: nucleotidyltransferase domain-containing protein [Bacteroidales bacterium]